jgi:hypothetical protein
MKTFKEYLTESAKTYDFKVKIAGAFTTEQEQRLKSALERFSVNKFKKASTTPIQKLPLDFPQVKNVEVTIYEVVLDYPATQFELMEYLSGELGVAKSHLVVKRPGEPTEEYQNQEPQREGALLNDSEYKESPNANMDDFFGSKYNSGFVKELNDVLKLQRKLRGEEIPTEAAVKYNTDSPEGTKSVLTQAPDPRK